VPTRSRPGDWLSTNRAWWDERVPAHAVSALYDVDAVAAGRDDLRPWEDAELGPLDGLDVVHLQCHIGTDTVALARRGAHTVGLDFSPPALRMASSLADRCGVVIEWVCADVHAAVTAMDGRSFDVVYTGIGALGWLPDLGRWARIASALLRPGGVLYVSELHPMWLALVSDGTSICQDAIGAQLTLWEGRQGSYAAPGATFGHTSNCQCFHTISDVLSAVLDAGMHIELFHEFDVTPCPTPWLVRGNDRLYRFGEGMYRFPLCYSLRARRPVS